MLPFLLLFLPFFGARNDHQYVFLREKVVTNIDYELPVRHCRTWDSYPINWLPASCCLRHSGVSISSLLSPPVDEHGGLGHGGSPPGSEEEGRPQDHTFHHLERDLREGGDVRAAGQHDPVPDRAVPDDAGHRHRGALLLGRPEQLPAHRRRRALRRLPRPLPRHRARLLRQPLRDVPAAADGGPAGVQGDPGVRGGPAAVLAPPVAAAASVRVVPAHVRRVRRHPSVRAGVRRGPAGQAGQQRRQRPQAADLLQLVLHRAGPLHRRRRHRHRLHPAVPGVGRGLRRARRAHAHGPRALPRRLALLPQAAGRPERAPRPPAGARRHLPQPPRAAAAAGRRRALPQPGRRQAPGPHGPAAVHEPGLRAPRQAGARRPRPVEALHGAAGGGRQGRRARAADLGHGDHARRGHRAADVPRAAGARHGPPRGPVRGPRGLRRRLQHRHAHRLGRALRPRARGSARAAHGPRARARPAPPHGPRPRALRRGHGRRRAHRGRPPRRRGAHVRHAPRAAALPHGARRGAQPHRPDRVLLLRVPRQHVQHRRVAARARIGVRRGARQRHRRDHRQGHGAGRVAVQRPQQGALRLLLHGARAAVRAQPGGLRLVQLRVRRGGAEQGGGGRRGRGDQGRTTYIDKPRGAIRAVYMC